MSNISAQDMADIRQDLLNESREEEYSEKMMYEDEEYCMQKCGLNEAIEELERAVRAVNEYGHEVTIQSAIGYL